MIPEIPSARLHELQRDRGICSEPECEQPIAGWCATCNAKGPFKAPKLCAGHLKTHQLMTAHRPYFLYDQVSTWLARHVERTLGSGDGGDDDSGNGGDAA